MLILGSRFYPAQNRTAGRGTDSPEGYCIQLRPSAKRHNSGIGAVNPAGLKLQPRHTVDNMLLRRIRANQVQLVILAGHIAVIHPDTLVAGMIQPEHWVGRVPE